MDQTERRAAIFGKRVSGMAGHLKFACQSAHGQNFFFWWGHPTGAYDRKRQEVAMVVRVLFVSSLCKSSCNVLNVIHLNYFMIELPCLKCDIPTCLKCRNIVTESYVISVT